MFGGQDRPRRDHFKGHSGQKRKKQLHNIKERKVDVLDKEITDLRSRYSQVRRENCVYLSVSVWFLKINSILSKSPSGVCAHVSS